MKTLWKTRGLAAAAVLVIIPLGLMASEPQGYVEPRPAVLDTAASSPNAPLFFAQAQPAGPVADIPDPVHNFEPTIDGDYVVHDFAVFNRGNAPLKIQKVSTT